MARVVNGGELGFNAILYNQPDQRTIDYFSNSINRAGQYLSGLGTSFMETTRAMFNKHNSDEAIMAAKAIISRLDTHINPDVIIALSLNTIAHAMPRMQEYIMVQPDMWELNNKQMCSAFDNMYNNIDPNVTSYKDHIRYMEAMDGIMQFNEDGDAYFETYSNSEMEELHFIDQLSIHATWDTVVNAIVNGIDPSDPNGGKL